MNKQELVLSIAEKTGTSQKQVKEYLEAFQESVLDAVSTDGKLLLVGFGTFSLVERKGRVCRNPKTGSPVNVPAKKTIKFKASDKLNEHL